MKKMTIILLSTIGFFWALFLTPKELVFTDRIPIKANSEKVWNLLTAVSDQVKWREDVKSVTITQGEGVVPEQWIQVPKFGWEIFFRTDKVVPGSNWEMSFSNKIMNGKWVGYIREVAPNVTVLDVKEYVTIRNPIYRAIFYYSSGLRSVAWNFLSALRRVAETA